MAFFSLALAITLAILYTARCSPDTATGVDFGGIFTIDLIHRDSINSPFYDRSMNFSQRLGHALQRSFINAKRYKANPNFNGSTYQTQIVPDHGEYLVNISFGSQSHKVMAIADTGSDLSWIPCKPCIKCNNHNLFDPKKSSTYKPIDCDSTACKGIDIDITCSSTNTCDFYESYVDGSFSNGSVSTETVTLGDRVFPGIVFGCALSDGGTFLKTWGGVIGFGGGEFSLVSQIRSFVTGRFSYCLIPLPLTKDLLNKSSKMTFGDIKFDPNAVSTPLVGKISKTFYFVTFEGISVGGRRMNLRDKSNSSELAEKGNMMVDSGTTLTMLPHRLYVNVMSAIKEALNLRTMKDPQKILDLCYRANKVKDMPKIIMHFDGADVELTKDNIFVTVSNHFICLAMAPTTSIPILGNVAQTNFVVGFDLENKKVSFERTNCEKL